MSRTDIQENFSNIVHRDAPKSVWDDAYIGTTSGSTGQPLKYLADGFSYLWYWAFVDAVVAMLALGIRWRRGRVDAVLLCALGHSPEYGDFIPVFHGVRFRKINVLAPGARQKLERLNPQLITGDPDSLHAVLQWELRPKLIMSSAFPMPPNTRQSLTKSTGAPVVEYYSAAETGMIGVNLPGRLGYEVLNPAVHVEVLPESGGNSDERLGEVVVTNLRNPWFPLIRYRLGDRAILKVPRTGSGAYVSIIEGLHGRTKERFATYDGHWFDPNLLVPILARSGYPEFAVSEETPGHYRLDAIESAAANSRAAEALTSRLQSLFGAPIELAITLHQESWREPGAKPRPFRPAERAD
ncbi:MAG: phenylacetate-CoA ligase [Bradymonadia bacterium]